MHKPCFECDCCKRTFQELPYLFRHDREYTLCAPCYNFWNDIRKRDEKDMRSIEKHKNMSPEEREELKKAIQEARKKLEL